MMIVDGHRMPLATLLTLAAMLVGLTSWLVTLQVEEHFLNAQVQVLRTRIEHLEQQR